jgi:hypothetical protein
MYNSHRTGEHHQNILAKQDSSNMTPQYTLYNYNFHTKTFLYETDIT